MRSHSAAPLTAGRSPPTQPMHLEPNRTTASGLTSSPGGALNGIEKPSRELLGPGPGPGAGLANDGTDGSITAMEQLEFSAGGTCNTGALPSVTLMTGPVHLLPASPATKPFIRGRLALAQTLLSLYTWCLTMAPELCIRQASRVAPAAGRRRYPTFIGCPDPMVKGV